MDEQLRSVGPLGLRLDDAQLPCGSALSCSTVPAGGREPALPPLSVRLLADLGMDRSIAACGKINRTCQMSDYRYVWDLPEHLEGQRRTRANSNVFARRYPTPSRPRRNRYELAALLRTLGSMRLGAPVHSSMDETSRHIATNKKNKTEHVPSAEGPEFKNT